MISQATIKNLSVSSLPLLDGESLLYPETIKKIQELAEDTQYDQEPGSAKDFYDTLLKLLSEFEQELGADDKAYDQYKAVLQSLFWKSFQSLESEQRIKAFSNNLLVSINYGIDAKRYLVRYFGILEFGGAGFFEKERSKFIQSIIGNNENIGADQITLKTQEKVSPTVGNWIKDYNMNVGSKSEHDRYDQVNYINSGPNTKALSAEDRQSLLKVIEIYDWLRFPAVDPAQLRLPSLQRVRREQGRPQISKIFSLNRSDAQKSKIKKPVREPAVKAPQPVAKIDTAPIAKKQAIPEAPIPKKQPATSNQQPAALAAPIAPTPEKEVLYRSTLDELHKMRNQYEKHHKPRKVPQAPVAKPRPKLIKRNPVSVNEAIIQEGVEATRFRGEIVAGEKEIEDKLKSLQKKVDKKNPNNK